MLEILGCLMKGPQDDIVKNVTFAYNLDMFDHDFLERCGRWFI